MYSTLFLNSSERISTPEGNTLRDEVPEENPLDRVMFSPTFPPLIARKDLDENGEEAHVLSGPVLAVYEHFRAAIRSPEEAGYRRKEEAASILSRAGHTRHDTIERDGDNIHAYR
eukprot:gb/GECG01010961.1/.p1 GENE.gb/GECG01010961.1/~~gb/GECG01010961.1/.p1  ORF type:complete len:115 (+),score=11.81 gb/GECG01010961.1/:1-345(+)